MNVNAVRDLLVHTARKSMPVRPAHVQTTAFVLIYPKDTMECSINVFVHTVSF